MTFGGGTADVRLLLAPKGNDHRRGRDLGKSESEHGAFGTRRATRLLVRDYRSWLDEEEGGRQREEQRVRPQDGLASAQPERQARLSRSARDSPPRCRRGPLPVPQRRRARQAGDAQQHAQGPSQVVTPLRYRTGTSSPSGARPLVSPRPFLLFVPIFGLGGRPRSPPNAAAAAPLRNLPRTNTEHIVTGFEGRGRD